MNKTQLELVSRLINRASNGSLKAGWTLTNSKDCIFLSLQKLNEGNQAHALAEKYPHLFSASQVSFRLVNLKLLDDSKAREKFKGRV